MDSTTQAEAPFRNMHAQWSRRHYQWEAPPEFDVQQLETLRRDTTDDEK